MMDKINALLNEAMEIDKEVNGEKKIMTKDYKRMRECLACKEAEEMPISELYDILLFGTTGYDGCDDEEIETLFISIWGEEQVPTK